VNVAYRRPDDLAFVITEDEDPPAAYLFPLPTGPVNRLEGTAALIWSLAVEGESDVPLAVAEILEDTEVGSIRSTVEDYLRYLLHERFIEEIP
jgi:hypothetical protein